MKEEERKIEKLIEENPQNKVQLLFHLASIKKWKGEFPEALRIYLDILRQEPENTEALYEISVLLVRAGQIDLAKLFVERALRINPSDPLLLHLKDIIERFEEHMKGRNFPSGQTQP